MNTNGVIRAVFAVFFSALLLFIAPAYSFAQDPVAAKFRSPDGRLSVSFNLEVAETPVKRMQGLMFRKTMNADSGMIFIFPESSARSFWMKDTYIPLDIIFLDEKFEVVTVLHDVPILNTQPRKSKESAQYVVELNAGAAARNGIEIGSKLVVSKPLPAAAE